MAAAAAAVCCGDGPPALPENLKLMWIGGGRRRGTTEACLAARFSETTYHVYKVDLEYLSFHVHRVTSVFAYDHDFNYFNFSH